MEDRIHKEEMIAKIQEHSNEYIDLIVLCGGKGKRLCDITGDRIPKSLYSVFGKKLIEYTIEFMGGPHIKNIILAVDHLDSQIIDWANKNLPKYIVSKQTKSGVYGALSDASKYVTSRYCVICNSDEIREGFNFDDFISDFLKRADNAVMLCTYSQNLYKYRYVICNQKGTIVKTYLKNMFIDERKSGLINCGVIIMPSSYLMYLDAKHGDGWSSIIDSLVEKRLLNCYVSNIRYFNMGTPEEINEYCDWKRTREIMRSS